MITAGELFHPRALARSRAVRANQLDDHGEPVIDEDDLAAIWEGRARMAIARLTAGVRLDGIDLYALDRRHLGLESVRSARSCAIQLTRLAADLRAVAAWLQESWPAELPPPVFAPVDPDREPARVVLWVHCPDSDTMRRALTALRVRPADVKTRAGYLRAVRRQGRVRVEVWCRSEIWRTEEQAA